MDNMIKVKPINKDEIAYLVRSLENLEKDKAIKGGLSAAGKVLATRGRSRLRKRMKSGSRGVTGNLLKSLIVRVKKKKPGVLIGFKSSGPHAHLVDRGTKERYWKTKSKKSVGLVKPNRFWSDTEAMDYPAAIDKLYIGIERAVDKISNRR
ncbi:HK97 gp10 family phage protein [Bacteroides propionicifaciens]|uniref:HK97 gp10 family phage protein n=2 Tax=Bacteroides propionicifaciens TaxID=392838 RepID=UPI000372A5C5|nr:HK97 gp10 family phage protein [Bacteroides propionicifaciens]